MFVVIALFASPFESTRIYLTATCYNKPSLHRFFNTMRLKRERGFGGGGGKRPYRGTCKGR